MKIEKASPDALRIIISLNPNSGSSDRRIMIDQLAAELRNRNFEVEILGDIDQVCQMASKYLESGDLHSVVSAGGDGTAGLLANRLPAEAPMAVFPLGTANLLAKFLGQKMDVQQLVETIQQGNMARLDAGLANGKLFLVVASCGFDSEVVRRLHKRRKGHISYLSYMTPVLRTIWKYKYPLMTFTTDDEQKLKPARWAFVFNMPQYAMGLRFSPEANAHDGLLNICTFRGGNLMTGLFYLVNILLGRHQKLAANQAASFKRMVIESEMPVTYELDGDPGGELPLTIEVVPERLKMLVSEDWISEHSVGD